VPAATFACLIHLRLSFDTIIQINRTRYRPIERSGCGPIPYHLLSGLGMYSFLLSTAKFTHCTDKLFLLFLESLPRDSYIGMYKRKNIIPQKLYKIGGLLEFKHSSLSELPLKQTRSTPAPTTFNPARIILHHRLMEWLSREVVLLPPLVY